MVASFSLACGFQWLTTSKPTGEASLISTATNKPFSFLSSKPTPTISSLSGISGELVESDYDINLVDKRFYFLDPKSPDKKKEFIPPFDMSPFVFDVDYTISSSCSSIVYPDSDKYVRIIGFDGEIKNKIGPIEWCSTPKLSPDCSWVACRSLDREADIFNITLINAYENRQQQLTNLVAQGYPSDSHMAFFEWTPDSKQIIFAVGKENKYIHSEDVYLINITDSTLKNFSNNWDMDTLAQNLPCGIIRKASWYIDNINISPNGDKILFHIQIYDQDKPGHEQEYHQYLFISDMEGSGLRVLDVEENITPSNQIWSPDGKFFIVSGDRKNQNSGADCISANPYITATLEALLASPGFTATMEAYDPALFGPKFYLFDSNGKFKNQLTDSGEDTHPIWSPDGTKIAFLSYRDHILCNPVDTNFPKTKCSEIYIMNSDGTDQKRITNDTLEHWIMMWIP